ncbi:MAG: hypothetical protein E6J42_07725 [Chloroflexi bacterium]|nr:MAG: hypothetical protein E6J42_07725 [Chloroflexota bacterium]
MRRASSASSAFTSKASAAECRRMPRGGVSSRRIVSCIVAGVRCSGTGAGVESAAHGGAVMSEDANKVPDAWVALPSREQARAVMPANHPYDFGSPPAMARLVLAHPGIAPFFGALFQRIMFEPGALSRPEREMVAAVTAAAQDCVY